MESTKFVLENKSLINKGISVESVILKIRNWIDGPGKKLLDSQNSKPHNFKEALEIRKSHEQFEFKCLKALSDYASLSDLRKADPPNELISKLDYDIQSYIDKLNSRTFFVVSCFTYFRVLDELWKLLDDLEIKSKGVSLNDYDSVVQTIECLEIGIVTSNDKVTTLTNEIERLRVMLQSSEHEYLRQIEIENEEACRLTANAQQIMQLRKLVLKKELKILECEKKISLSVSQIQVLSDTMEATFTGKLIGKSPVEANTLITVYRNYSNQLRENYEECRQLYDTYRQMCESDLRQMRKPTLLLKSQVAKLYPQLRKRIEEVIHMTEDAEQFYTNTDSLLSQVGEVLLNISKDRNMQDDAMKLDTFSEMFMKTKTTGLSLMNNITSGVNKDQKSNWVDFSEEIKSGIRLKLYTLCLKLQEYERAVSRNSDRFGTADEFAPLWRSQSPRKKTIPQSLARSPSSSQSWMEGSNMSPRPHPRLSESAPAIPPRITPSPVARNTYQTRSSENAPTSNYVNMFNTRLLELKSTYSIQEDNPVTSEDLKRVLQQHDESRRQATEEWLKLNTELKRGVSGRMMSSCKAGTIRSNAENRYQSWLSDWKQERDSLFPRKKMLDRVDELEHDLSDCSNRLDHLIEVTCNPGVGDSNTRVSTESLLSSTPSKPRVNDVSIFYLRQLESINDEVAGMRQTVPAQERFIKMISEDVTTAFKRDATKCLARVNHEWNSYLQKLTQFETLLPSLIQGSQLLASANTFTSALHNKLDSNNGDPNLFNNIQKEARRLQEQIEHHLDTGEQLQQQQNINEFSVTQTPVDWLTSGLNSALGPLQEAGEEAEMMAVNMTTSSNNSDEVFKINSKPPQPPPSISKRSPSLHSSSPSSNFHQKRKLKHEAEQNASTSPTTLSPDVFGAPDAIPHTSPEQEQSGRTFSTSSRCSSERNSPKLFAALQDQHVSPGECSRLECNFKGFGDHAIVNWKFKPQNSSAQSQAVAAAILAMTTEAKSDGQTASLLIPNILYKHAGEYTVTITNPLTGHYTISSAQVHVKAQFKRGLNDTSAVIGGNNDMLAGQEVEFSMFYCGFEKIPSRVMWLHNGKPIDPIKWTVSISPTVSRIISNCLKQVDEGQYTCQVSDLDNCIHFESSAKLSMTNALDVSKAASRSQSFSGGARPTVAHEGSPLSLKCPLPAAAFERYDLADGVRMQWFRDGIQLYDSGLQQPAFFTSAVVKGCEFTDGNTVWTASIINQNVLLNTQRVRQVDAGRYTCRVFIDDDAYESSGIISVSGSPQFVERLSSIKVYLGEPVTLRCRVDPWISSLNKTQSANETKITWYQFSTVITDDLQRRVGIRTSVVDGVCSLYIDRVSKQFAGIYKCEAKNPLGVCETSCRLLIDQPVKPTILEPIHCKEDRLEMEDSVEFHVEYDAVPQPQVVWTRNNVPLVASENVEILTGKDESVLRLMSPTSEHSGEYTAIVSNVAGCAKSKHDFNFRKVNKDKEEQMPIIPTSPTSPTKRPFESSILSNKYSSSNDSSLKIVPRPSSVGLLSPTAQSSYQSRFEILQERPTSITPTNSSTDYSPTRISTDFQRFPALSFISDRSPKPAPRASARTSSFQSRFQSGDTANRIPKAQSPVSANNTSLDCQSSEHPSNRIQQSIRSSQPYRKSFQSRFSFDEDVTDRNAKKDTLCNLSSTSPTCISPTNVPRMSGQSDVTFLAKGRKPKTCFRSSTPNQSDVSLSSESKQQPRLFVIKPQSLTANAGESVSFSCLIRPPDGSPRIHRVVWRHEGGSLPEEDGNTKPRVRVKENDPAEGVFQLELSNLTEGEHGQYEVIALSAEDEEICSANFNLCVAVERPCQLTSGDCKTKQCRHKIRVTTTTYLNKLKPSNSLPNLLSNKAYHGNRLSLAFNYKLDSPSSQPEHRILEHRESRNMYLDSSAVTHRRSGVSETKCGQSRDSTTWASFPGNPTQSSKLSQAGKITYRSLPDVHSGQMTHNSTTIIEQFKLRSESPNSTSGISLSPRRKSILRSSIHDEDEEMTPRNPFFIKCPALPSFAKVAAGGRLEITCHVGGDPLPHVIWLKDGRPLGEQFQECDFQITDDGLAHQLIIPSAKPHHSGVWEVVGRNSAGIVLSSSSVIVDQISSKNAQFAHVVSVDDSNLLKTRRNPRRSSTSPLLSEHSSIPRPSSAMKRTEIYLTHTVVGQAPSFTRLFHDRICQFGDDVQLECCISGSPDPKITWEFNGQELDNNNPDKWCTLRNGETYSLLLKSVNDNCSGRYSVSAENDTGLASCSALLYVENNDDLTLSVPQLEDELASPSVNVNSTAISAPMSQFSKVDTIESPGHTPLRLESNLKSSSPWLIHINPKQDDGSLSNRQPTGFLSPTSKVDQSEPVPKFKLSHLIEAQQNRAYASKTTTNNPLKENPNCSTKSENNKDDDNSSVGDTSGVVMLTRDKKSFDSRNSPRVLNSSTEALQSVMRVTQDGFQTTLTLVKEPPNSSELNSDCD